MRTPYTGLTNLLRLIQAEYREMPGLHLTRPQVQRLWNLDEETCEALLDALEGAHFLRRTPGNAYVLDGVTQ
jgi:hypothetical protein